MLELAVVIADGWGAGPLVVVAGIQGLARRHRHWGANYKLHNNDNWMGCCRRRHWGWTSSTSLRMRVLVVSARRGYSPGTWKSFSRSVVITKHYT